MVNRRIAIKISGPAGTGIMQAGETFSKALSKLGFFTLVYPEYPSRIRGGDNNIQIIFSSEEFLAPQEKIDLLLAFGEENFKSHKSEGIKGFGGYEGAEVGLNKIAEELGNPLVLNTAGLGFLWGVLKFNLEILKEQIKEDFEKEEVRKINLKAVEKGYELGQKLETRNWKLESKKRTKIVNLTGNEALVKGILEAKCGFAAIYPMTPINEILRLLAQKKEVKLFRPEDEIAGVLSAIGASYAGERAMVATSGGGYSLMIEGVGMAGMAEIPLVIVLGQRTGPSSGMATYSSQADLNFAIFGGHGDFPRIVLTPGDLGELRDLGVEAFNLAEKYQVPVILMTDKYLAESRFSVLKTKMEGEVKMRDLRGMGGMGNYQRYQFTKSGVSARAIPGETTFLTNSYEHDEYGFSSDDTENRRKMMEKRMEKLEGLEGARLAETGESRWGYGKYGRDGAKTTLVSWGSTKGILLDFVNEHPQFNLIHFYRPWPFPKEAEKVLRKAKRLIVVEGNYSGQMTGLIRRETGLSVESVLKDDGRPFFKEELERKIRSTKSETRNKS